jgi:hypothetical protein
MAAIYRVIKHDSRWAGVTDVRIEEHTNGLDSAVGLRSIGPLAINN